MATYYFDMFDGSKVVTDEYGENFASVQDAAEQAAGLLVDFAREALPSKQGQDYGVAVRNDASSDVYRAALIFRESYPDPRRPEDPRDICPIVSLPNPVDLIRRSRDTRAASERITAQLRETASNMSDMVRQAMEAVAMTRTIVTAGG